MTPKYRVDPAHATTVRVKVGSGAVRSRDPKLRKATVTLRFAFTDGAVQTQKIAAAGALMRARQN